MKDYTYVIDNDKVHLACHTFNRMLTRSRVSRLRDYKLAPTTRDMLKLAKENTSFCSSAWGLSIRSNVL